MFSTFCSILVPETSFYSMFGAKCASPIQCAKQIIKPPLHFLIKFAPNMKSRRVSPVDNKPFTNWLHNFFHKKIN